MDAKVKKILIIEDEYCFYDSIKEALSVLLGEIDAYNSYALSEIQDLINSHEFDLVTLDYNLFDPQTGERWKGTDLIPLLEEKGLSKKTIIVSDEYSINDKIIEKVATVFSKTVFIHNTDVVGKILKQKAII